MSNTYEWLNKEKSRFYIIDIQKEPTQIQLNYSWGSLHTRRGGRKSIRVQSKEEAQQYINNMMKRRKSRGYELIAPRLN